METEKTMLEGRKPLIGVMPLVDVERESYWMLPGYFNGIREAGGIPIMLPLTDNEEELKQIAETFDGFIFTGGPDVSPDIYSEEPNVDNLVTCRDRDDMELPALKMILEKDKPILGICRGFQFINAALGGSLYQDLPTQRPSEIRHSQERPYDAPSHKVRVIRDSPLYELLYDKLEEDYLWVNSCHHQGIKDLAKGLAVMSETDDGLVEAYYMPHQRFVWCVQWHPEFMYKKDEPSQMLFAEFIKNCL